MYLPAGVGVLALQGGKSPEECHPGLGDCQGIWPTGKISCLPLFPSLSDSRAVTYLKTTPVDGLSVVQIF